MRYFTSARPATIFLHGVLMLLVAPFLVAAEVSLLPGGPGFGESLSMSLSGNGEHLIASHPHGPGDLFRSGLVWVVRIAARIAATLGYALPVWAAARLIADALGVRAGSDRAPTH